MNSNMTNVHPGAKIGRNVVISPFTTIAEHVEIGDNCWIGPNVTIFDYVRIGHDCKVFPGAVLGAIPQDLKFQGEVTWAEIGDNTTIREFVTVNRGTAFSGKGVTRVGNNCLIMSYCHVAHDCRVGDHCILSSYAVLGGEVDVDDWAILGGGAMVHQFSTIGCHAMVAGAAIVIKDVPPYILTGRNPISFAGVNRVGLTRRGFDPAVIQEISSIYKMLYNSGLNVSDACAKIRETFPESVYRETILSFIAHSQRGILR
ncbi:MAG: acyl-ACP--UDP-N-acetylglucosamine O-acyltransferase [Bacteroidales bacterium]|nr:acyl-ACP--UDP-N-acetylglucosamine O-acyltransferase [Bacteroidales bacterium]